MLDQRRRILRESAAVGLATGAYGVSFGAIAVAGGLTPLQTCALSALVFTGASQFAFVGVVSSGGAPMAGAMTALLLGSRNALYGLRLAALLQLKGIRRTAAAQLVIDESTAMTVTRDNTADARLGFFATGLSVFVLWNAATLVGAVAGSAVGDPSNLGLDAAVAAAFVALLWPRLVQVTHRVTAVLAAALAIALTPVLPVGLPVMTAALVALAVGLPRGYDSAATRRTDT